METIRRGVRTRRVELLVALAILALSGTIYHDLTDQPASRYLLTVAAADDRSLELDPYVDILGIDRAEYRGHTYSDKAPYQPLAAAVPYQAFRWAGGEPFPTVAGEPDFTDGGRPTGLWWVTVWSSTLPAIVVALAILSLLRRTHPHVALPVSLGLVLGTIILPFSAWLFGHVLAAMAVALAWRGLRDPAAGTRAVLVGGLWMGVGIGTEFAVAVLALLALVDLAVRRRWGAGLWLSLGTVITTVPLMVYNQLAFEGPFETAYQGHLPNFQGSGALGVYNLQGPALDEVAKALVGDRGLLTLTPVMLAAVVGSVVAVRAGGSWRRDGTIALVGLIAMVVVSTGIDGYGGTSPGPRYLIPVFPLLAVPLAVAWERRPRLVAATALFGAVAMGLASLTDPFVDTDYTDSLRTWRGWAGEGDWAANIFTGSSSTPVTLAAVAVSLLAIGVALQTERAGADQPIR